MYEQPSQQPPQQPQGPPSDERPKVDAAKLWAGGGATAVVAALVAVIGIMIARGVLDIYILAPEDHGTWDAASATSYAVGAVVAALGATALMHLLLLTTPRPVLFFGWIMFLVAVVGAVWPFTTSADLDSKVATAALNVVIAVAIWSLVAGTAQRAVALPPGHRL